MTTAASDLGPCIHQHEQWLCVMHVEKRVGQEAHLYLPKVNHGTSLQECKMYHERHLLSLLQPGNGDCTTDMLVCGLAFVPQGMSTTLSVCKVTWMGA